METALVPFSFKPRQKTERRRWILTPEFLIQSLLARQLVPCLQALLFGKLHA